MAKRRNPIKRRGDRNALCPFYGDCLDEAVLKSWDYWDCSGCEYRFSRDPSLDILNIVNDSMPYYELPEGFREEFV